MTNYGVNAYQSAAVSQGQQIKTQTFKAKRSDEKATANKASAVYEKGGAETAAVESYDRNGKPISGSKVASRVTQQNATSGTGNITNNQSYGKVVGEPKLSETAQKYYDSLKQKYGNLDFVLVSKDMVGVAKSRAASYGNANKMVVLIDEEKLERMATDESYRKKYEGIIAQAQSGGSSLQSAIAGNPAVKKVGINTLDNGAGSFMAACAKNTTDAAEKLAKKRAEKKAAQKAADKKAEKKKAEKAAEEKKEAKKAEAKKEERRSELRDRNVIEESDFSEYTDNDDYEIIYANSMEELIEKINAYGKGNTSFGGSYMDYQA